jgi:hypothetical protein
MKKISFLPQTGSGNLEPQKTKMILPMVQQCWWPPRYGFRTNLNSSTGNFLVFAGDRISNSGDAQIGFWFFQNGTAPVTVSGVNTFSPEKHGLPAPGDILVLADFTGGGRNATVIVLQWTPGTGTYPNSDNNFTQLVRLPQLLKITTELL